MNQSTSKDPTRLGSGVGKSGMTTQFPNELTLTLSTNKPIIAPPWGFLLVCKKWKQVALATPDLWNDILVNYDEGSYGYDSLNAHKRIVAAERTDQKLAHLVHDPSTRILRY
ncbi:hypothetical protein BDZ94DRAFT_855535 [Collybia nuda]|uniref:F-box domain-containing protein n=1 Tax=Collybia nuda TaxID=64659 RepID=A0A9P5XPF5_9AGAR|nr:hypothetical protein BDZ94DRAFT_855535 [Collybia nuda]